MHFCLKIRNKNRKFWQKTSERQQETRSHTRKEGPT